MQPSNMINNRLVKDEIELSKELKCLYSIEAALNKKVHSIKEAFRVVIDTIPQGLLYGDKAVVKIIYEDKVFNSPNFLETPWILSFELKIHEKVVGQLYVCYKQRIPNSEEQMFSNEEYKLIETIAQRLSHYILYKRLQNVVEEVQSVRTETKKRRRPEWRVILDMIRKTDPNLFFRLLRKLLHQLCWDGVAGADKLLELSTIEQKIGDKNTKEDGNKPLKKKVINTYNDYIEAILTLAYENISREQILAKLLKWIKEDKSSGLIKALESQDTSLMEISDSIRRYFHLAPEKFEVSESTKKGLRVSLLRRFFTDQLSYINIAKEYVKITDFYKIIDKMVFPPSSHGKLGGKSAGLFLAKNILENCAIDSQSDCKIKTPKTWYIASDGIMYFMHYNDLEDVLEQKYKDINEVRLEYAQIVQVFKNSQFPPDMIKGLAMALDDFGDKPLIVRSSSLMEDQIGAAFSGKYKSLFLANQGTKSEKLAALLDAVAEVYASTFGQDPIEYRIERGLIDFHEEMGIMIQEVVGNKVGKYFFPAFAGVAFSYNEFRWSPRINREDGLVRLVPGLGTRAVDRIGDDYPVLAAPGQPNLRVNITIEEMLKYSPKNLDVINLETNDFETIGIQELLSNTNDEYPQMNNVFSIVTGNMIRPVLGISSDYNPRDLVANFDGLFNRTNFLKKINVILKTLQEKLKSPVDIEFACDDKDFYLLQCRPQNHDDFNVSDTIPDNISAERILFSANKFVSNGKSADITNIVYVDPIKYSELPDEKIMKQVGRAVGKLNKILPKRQFILMGPGRWGSRGDIKLGVSVTYADINNTAMLIEIAKKKGNYIPDLSFGTHFFQDLSEASIRYLPLYPDDEDVIFNEDFFCNSINILPKILPEYSHLSEVIKVIDVPTNTNGLILKILMNADLDKAVGILANPSLLDFSLPKQSKDSVKKNEEWRWRMSIAKAIANQLVNKRFGVIAVYLFGGIAKKTAGPKSDIDLIIHISNKPRYLSEVKAWLDGWDKSLIEINEIRTGYRLNKFIDFHFVNDNEIEKKIGFASKINAISDSAMKLTL